MFNLKCSYRRSLGICAVSMLIAASGAATADMLATGSDTGEDNYLGVDVRAFGDWASIGFGGGGDIFNPAGPSGPLEVTFTNTLILFVPGRSQRAQLSENAGVTSLGNDGSLTLSVTSPASSSDIDANGVADTQTSSFRATGTDTVLDFDVAQWVANGNSGGAVLYQTYTITNNAASAVDFELARTHDADLIWSGNFTNDEVGTGFNAAGGERFVFQHEVSDPVATSLTISSPQAFAYYGAKQGVLPAGGPPAYGFGTSTELITNGAYPISWVNHIANVGYDTDGVSGSGSGDAAIGLGWNLSLDPGESTTVNIRYSYGSQSPSAAAPPVPPTPVPALGWSALAALMVLFTLTGGLFIRRWS